MNPTISPTYVQPQNLSADFLYEFKTTLTRVIAQPLPDIAPDAALVDNVFTPSECRHWQQQMEDTDWIAVGPDGILAHYDPQHDPIGSWRATFFSPEMADIVWHRLHPVLHGHQREMDGATWEAVGVNPMLRVIRYTPEGFLVPHYDAPYIENDDTQSMLSCVLYLRSDDETCGATRFLHDEHPDPTYADWQQQADAEDIAVAVQPHPGSALLFPHRLLHDSQQISDGEKWIIRTDIMYRRQAA